MLTLGRDLLIITLLLITIEHASSQKDSKDSPSTTRYCGRNLVNVMVMVCDGIYNQLALKEGLEKLARAEAAQKAAAAAAAAASSTFRQKRSIFKSKTLVRHRRGAYEDCCRVGCTIDEMTNYCGA